MPPLNRFQIKSLKKHISCILLLVIFLLPSVYLSLHSFHCDNHSYFTSKVDKQFHDNDDVDCDLHLIKLSTPFLKTTLKKPLVVQKVTTVIAVKYSFLKNYQQLSFSLRGPPSLS